MDDMEYETGFMSDVEDDSSGTVENKPEVHFSSSTDMSEVGDESVHLIVTSPPYNAGWDYGSVDDDMDYGTEYLPMLAEVFNECYRVLVPGGRMCVNVPTLLRDGANGGFPISSDISVMLLSGHNGLNLHMQGDQEEIAELRSQTEWIMREEISWLKGFNTDGLAPNGSYPRPWGILLNNMHESVMIFQKPGDRDVSSISDKRKEDSEIVKDTKELCDDVWEIHPESWDFKFVDEENVPVFPEELPKRCIKIWTYKGDRVLDPFGGRGTTCKMAKQMGRDSVMYELREELEEDIRSYVGLNQPKLDQWD